MVRLALVVAGLAVAACLWTAWCEFALYGWNGVRLAPAFGLREGINPYPPLGGGPLSTWIYGPVAILINLPATFAPTPRAALQAASLINMMAVIAPLAVIFFSSAELRAGGRAVAGLALALGILLLSRWHFSLQVADRTAIACGWLSCWCLVRRATPGASRLAVAALFGALGVWAKQIESFLFVAQFAFAWATFGRSSAWRYLAWFGAWNVLFATGAGVAFGFGNLWFNLVVVPGRLPWAEFGPRLALQPADLFGPTVLPGLALLALRRTAHWPGSDTESGRLARLGVYAFVAMLPVGFSGYFKIGGGTNLLHSWDYLLPGALACWLARERFAESGGKLRLVAAAVLAIALHAADLAALPRRPFVQDFRGAAAIAAQYRGAAWFPQDPLITLYSDGRLWHSEDGLLTRHLAGFGVREAEFRRHLPEPLHAVVYPSMVEHPFALGLLPEFNQRTRQGYWTIHTRPAPAPKP